MSHGALTYFELGKGYFFNQQFECSPQPTALNNDFMFLAFYILDLPAFLFSSNIKILRAWHL